MLVQPMHAAYNRSRATSTLTALALEKALSCLEFHVLWAMHGRLHRNHSSGRKSWDLGLNLSVASGIHLDRKNFAVARSRPRPFSSFASDVHLSFALLFICMSLSVALQAGIALLNCDTASIRHLRTGWPCRSFHRDLSHPPSKPFPLRIDISPPLPSRPFHRCFHRDFAPADRIFPRSFEIMGREISMEAKHGWKPATHVQFRHSSCCASSTKRTCVRVRCSASKCTSCCPAGRGKTAARDTPRWSTCRCVCVCQGRRRGRHEPRGRAGSEGTC